jgi:hypothetical protein
MSLKELLKHRKFQTMRTLNEWNDEGEAKLEKAEAKISNFQKWVSDKERLEEIMAQSGAIDHI